MAEIKISIFAENRTQDALSAIEEGVTSMCTIIEAAASQAESKLTSVFTNLNRTKAVGTPVDALEGELLSLDAQLEKERVLTIDTSGAMENLRAIVDMQSQIAGSSLSSSSAPDTSIYSTAYDNYESISSTPEVLGSFATGTDYVPRTGIYQLHRGEKVTPATQNNNSHSSSNSSVAVTFASGAIVINGVNKSTDELVDEMAKPLQRKFKSLGVKTGA